MDWILFKIHEKEIDPIDPIDLGDVFGRPLGDVDDTSLLLGPKILWSQKGSQDWMLARFGTCRFKYQGVGEK